MLDVKECIEQHPGHFQPNQCYIPYSETLRNSVKYKKKTVNYPFKPENLLVETGSAVPRVRVLDFGCGCIIQDAPYTEFLGTFPTLVFSLTPPPPIHIKEQYIIEDSP